MSRLWAQSSNLIVLLLAKEAGLGCQTSVAQRNDWLYNVQCIAFCESGECLTGLYNICSMHRRIAEWDDPRIDKLEEWNPFCRRIEWFIQGSSLKEGGEGEEGKTDYNIFLENFLHFEVIGCYSTVQYRINFPSNPFFNGENPRPSVCMCRGNICTYTEQRRQEVIHRFSCLFFVEVLFADILPCLHGQELALPFGRLHIYAAWYFNAIYYSWRFPITSWFLPTVRHSRRN